MDFRNVHDNLIKAPGRIVRYWPQVLALIADVSAVVAIFIACFCVDNKPLKEIILTSVLAGFFVLILGFVIWQEYRYSRKSRYAEATYSIHNCVHLLRDYYSLIDTMQEEDCKYCLTKVITSLANAFSLVTGTHCRACIETLQIKNYSKEDFYKLTDPRERVKYLYADTFCRDSITSTSNSEEEIDSNIHPVNNNTDFRELYVNADMRFFYCKNTLKSNPPYQSTAIVTDGKLPYKSILVWPIRKMVSSQDKPCVDMLNKKQDIIGYLCVDSARRDVFNEGYDVEMGAIIADSMFTFLKYYHARLNRNNEVSFEGKKC
jgi:hypothetical protein